MWNPVWIRPILSACMLSVMVAASYAQGPYDYRGGSTKKPFSDYDRGSTLSPYLGLLRDDANDELPAYFALVRPQLEQQAVNRQQRRAYQQLDRQVQQMRTQAAYPTSGATEIRPTGHEVRFMNYLHYYRK